jgi:hypothetical protein
MTSVMPLTTEQLVTISGGAPKNQDQLRAMARRWCPQTAERYANTPTLTRRMGEQCLAEANLSQYSSQLDKYFR